MRLLILCVLLTSLSCSKKTFDASVTEQQPAGSGSIDSTTEIVAEDMSFIKIEPSELFVLNPVSDTRNTERINLVQNNTVQKMIVMKTEKKSWQQSLTAKNRSWHSKQVTQTGSNGEKRTDTRRLKSDKGLLDLLLVIDDSKSMQIVHENLKDKLSSLLYDIKNSNWKINIIDVDDPQTCDNTVITMNNEADYRAKLVDLKTSAGNNPNANERTLQKAKAALSGSCNSWLRTDSTLAAVIITDEDHQCTNSGAGDNFGNNTNSFMCGTEVNNFITAFRGLRKHTSLYGILVTELTCGSMRSFVEGCFKENDPHFDPLDPQCVDTSKLCYKCRFTNPCFNRKDGDKYLANYLDLAAKFDDTMNIYSSDYSKLLKVIAAGIKGKLQDQFTLTLEPDSGAAVTVTVDGKTKTQGSDFQIKGKVLTFMQDPGGDNIVIKYVPKGGVTPFISTMTVESQADMSNLTVSVAGNRLAKKHTLYGEWQYRDAEKC